MTKWFVMLCGGDDKPLPLVDDNEYPMLYDSEDEANAAGENNLLGAARGFEVYEWNFM